MTVRFITQQKYDSVDNWRPVITGFFTFENAVFFWTHILYKPVPVEVLSIHFNTKRQALNHLQKSYFNDILLYIGCRYLLAAGATVSAAVCIDFISYERDRVSTDSKYTVGYSHHKYGEKTKNPSYFEMNSGNVSASRENVVDEPNWDL